MDKVKFRLTGTAPLLMNNRQKADPLNAFAKRLKALTSKRAKTDDNHLEIARAEFEGGLYWNEDLGPYVPSQNLRAMIVEMAKIKRGGRDVKRAVQVHSHSPLKYKGPRDVEGLWEAGFHLTLMVKTLGGGVVRRTRPAFTDWQLDFEAWFFDARVSRDVLISYVLEAGDFTCLCDYRPDFGRFSAEVLK